MSPFRDIILDACLHCYSHDPQIDGTRASYMHDLVSLLPDKDFYYTEILNSLPTCQDDWDARQCFHFAACLAFERDENAKRAMYAAYNPGPTHGESIAFDFVKMDGIDGFLFAARKLGALLATHPDKSEIWFLLSDTLELCGEQETWNALESAAAADPDVARYTARAKASLEAKNTEHPPRPALSSLTYAELLHDKRSSMVTFFWRWGEEASDDQLQLAAQGLLSATDPKQQLTHLRIFAQRRFPLDPAILLSLVDIEANQIGFAAVAALTQITDPRVRALAFRLMDESTSRSRRHALDLLSQNFEPGDHARILQWFLDEQDPDTIHAFGSDLRDFWERHPDPDTEAAMLTALYERGPCAWCREKAVKRLLELGALSDQIRLECAWDSDDDIRALVSTDATEES